MMQPAQYEEISVAFGCNGEQLVGVLAAPATVAHSEDIGLVVIVGGPQYRVGSHRQFLHLSRSLAQAGFPVLRFDVRGMGDSSGPLHAFEDITPDIAAAIHTLQEHMPQVRRIVLWGLCDGASAALLYLDTTHDSRVCGACLLNPWVRSEASLARAHVKHYYVDRLKQKEFWQKLLSGRIAFSAVQGLWRNLQVMLSNGSDTASPATQLSYQDRMVRGWQSTTLQILLLLSEDDYTAKEFLEYVKLNPAWSGLLDSTLLTRQELAGADHTLSVAGTQQAAENKTLEWLKTLLPHAAGKQS